MGASDLSLHAAPVPLALTRAQHGIWLGQQTDPSSSAYLTAECLTLDGPLDEAAFIAAVHVELTCCDALHMQYHQTGGDVLQVLHRDAAWQVPVIDLADEAAAECWMHEALTRTVDLSRGPLFATALLRLAPERHLWFLCAHHIALDGFGHALLASRVAQAYRERTGHEVPAPLPMVSMAQLVDEDLRYQASDAAERDRAFWLRTLAGTGEPPSLASPAPLACTVVRGRGTVQVAEATSWQAAAACCGSDLPSWLIAGVAVWLHGRTGASSLTLGLPVMNRLGSVALRLPCMAMNIVPLRIDVLADDTARSLTERARGQLRAMRPHSRHRYEQLRDDQRAHGGPQRLFGPVVNLMPFERPLDFGPLQVQSHPVSAGPVEDISITLAPRGDTWQFDVDANPNAYSPDEVQAWRRDLLNVLDHVAADSDVPLASLWQAMPAHVGHGEPIGTEPPHVLESFVASARARPSHPAVSHGDRSMTYGQLLFSVQALAGHLAAHGATEGARVVVLLPRSMQAVTVILATLWTGASYVPIDPDGPPARLALVLNDAAPSLVITLSAHANKVTDGWRTLCLDDDAAYEPPMPEPVRVGAASVAYVIYTSGSTGRPNGVMVGQGALAHFIHGARQRYEVVPADRVLQFAPLHFDASVEEMFLSLTSGATLVLRTDEMLDSLAAFTEGVAHERITVLDLPTAFWHELAFGLTESNGRVSLSPTVRLVIIGGEAALPERVRRWRQAGPAHAVLLNTYGPTETTVICTTAVLAGPGASLSTAGAAPIGRPLPGVGVVVVDERLRPVPPGVQGELCVLGGGLALGYLNQPERTALRFLPLVALPGAPMAYRTGDLVRVEADGQLRFLGRSDDELKISGHRVDPLEIETALLSFDGVREAAVVPRDNPRGDKVLTAFVVADPMPSAATLRAHLAQRLAEAALPTRFVPLERLPRNANNKIDRGALRRRPIDDAAPAADTAPLTETQSSVMAVWRDVLGIDRLGAESDFFAAGGRSLQAIQVAHRLGLATGRDVPVSMLFRHPTVAALAAALDEPVAHRPPPAAAGGELAPLLSIQPGQGPALFCMHPAEGLSWCYFGLSRWLPSTPIYGIQASGLTAQSPGTFNTMADAATAQVRAARPTGPYRLLGWSSGAGLAHAVAVRLRSLGETVDLLAMMDGYPSEAFEHMPSPRRRDALEAVLDVIGASPDGADGQPLTDDALRARLVAPGSTLASYGNALVDRMVDTALHTMQLYRGVHHERFDGPVLFFRAMQRKPEAPEPSAWSPHVAGPVQLVHVDSTHSAMSQPGPLAHVGRALAAAISALGAP